MITELAVLAGMKVSLAWSMCEAKDGSFSYFINECEPIMLQCLDCAADTESFWQQCTTDLYNSRPLICHVTGKPIPGSAEMYTDLAETGE